MKAKRVKKVRLLLLRYPPKKLLLNKGRASSSDTTSTAIQLDNCLRNSTTQKPEEGHRRNGWSQRIQRRPHNQTLSPRVRLIKPTTVSLCSSPMKDLFRIWTSA